MAKGNNSEYKKMIDKQYKDLMQHCQAHMEKVEKDLPEPREDFQTTLKEHGVSRRDFIKWTSAMTAALMLPPIFRPLVAKAAENFSRLPVVWLHFAECTGCSEAFLRSSYPNVDDILLETISLEYHETLMAASGYQAEQNLEKAMNDFAGKFICVIEGGLPRGLDGKYLRLGPKGKTGLEIGKEVSAKAAAVVCIGACAANGNIQAARPNPTDATGVGQALGIKTVNIAGCPPNAVNFPERCFIISCSALCRRWIPSAGPCGLTESVFMIIVKEGLIMMPRNLWKSGAIKAPKKAGACIKSAAKAHTLMPTAARFVSTTPFPGR